MADHLTIIASILNLILGMFAIYTSFIEQNRYKTPLTKSIFHFLIITNLAIVINLFYNYFLVNLIGDLDFYLVKSIELLYRFLANILLIFVYGIFITFFRRLNGETFSKKYKYSLLSIWIILMMLFSIKINSMFFNKIIPIPILINLLIDHMGMVIVTFETIRTLVKLTKNPDPVRRNIVRNFSFGFLFIIVVLLSMTPLTIFTNISNGIQTFISLWIFLLFNLLPVLLLKRTLENYYYDLPAEKTFSGNLSELLKTGRISETEANIVNMICDGLTNKEISDKLFLSLQTIKDHNYRIYKKLKVSNRVQLTKRFLKR